MRRRVVQNGKILLERAYGMANLEYDVPLKPDSIFEAGSVTRQFTAAALVILANDGKLSLDYKARKYIPELDASASEVTIRQMLFHEGQEEARRRLRRESRPQRGRGVRKSGARSLYEERLLIAGRSSHYNRASP